MMSAQDGVLGQVLKVLQKITPIADEAMAEFLISLCCDSNGIKEFEQKLEENEAPFEHETIEEIYDICNSGRKGSVKREKTVIKRESDDTVKLEQLDDGGIIKREPVVKLEYNDHISNVKGEQPNGYSNRKYDYNEKKNSVKKEEDDEVDEFGRSIKSRYRRDKELPEESVSYKHVDLYDSAPTEGKVYQGRVVNITNFGAFVRLSSIRPQGSQRYVDGLCHISQISTERIEHPSDIVSVNETVYVKIVKIDGKRISLSMKNVDQITGQEVKPADEYDRHRGRQKNVGERRPKRALTSPERWELRQLISSGAISIKEHPELEEDLNDFTADINLEPEVEVDIEVKQEEPPFLVDQKSHLKSIGDGDLDSLKIVQKPNGSLNRAAMNGSQLAKELKERKLKELREKRLKAISEKRKKGATEDDPFNQNSNGQSDKQAEEELSVLSEWQKANMKQKISYGKRTEAPIDEQRRSLPVYKMRTKLLDIVRDNQFIVIVGETGSGKTTQITQYLAEDGFAKHGMIGCTQPRRVAAVSVAKRVSEEVGCKLGEEVGYFIRFEDVTSRNTKIKYMTDGMLQREALIDPDMSRYSVIMLDEAHERTIATDVLFALLKKAAQKRPDLKVIVTSATLDADKFSKYFYNCPILKIPGRTFPVEILYTKEPEFDYLAACLDTVLQIHISEPAGDILVFLTGQEEIDTACEALFERVKSLGKSIPELIILPVYSSLPSEVQSRIFEPTPKGSRKCVIATNIAETSITIDGIFYVIDPGFVKINAYDSKLGMDSLVVSPISQAQANQRAGRAGRTGPGKCYRLYTENAYKNEMVPNTVPEIQRQNLSNTILMLKAMGIDDLIHFDFMDPPPMKTMMVALEELYNLSALDENGYLTKLGKKMADFPMDPSLAKSLISSVELRCSDELSTIVAMLSVQTVFYRPKNKQQQADMKKSKFNNVNGDHLTLLNTYNAWVQNNYSKKWCEENYVQERSLKRARDVRNQLIKIFVKYRHRIDSCGRDYDRIRKALCSGFFKNSAKRDSQESGAYKTLIENTPVYMHPSSALFGKRAEHVIYHTLLLTSREYMHCVTTIEPKWLVEVAPTFFKIGDPNSKNRKNEKIVSLSSKKRKLQRQ